MIGDTSKSIAIAAGFKPLQQPVVPGAASAADAASAGASAPGVARASAAPAAQTAQAIAAAQAVPASAASAPAARRMPTRKPRREPASDAQPVAVAPDDPRKSQRAAGSDPGSRDDNRATSAAKAADAGTAQ